MFDGFWCKCEYYENTIDDNAVIEEFINELEKCGLLEGVLWEVDFFSDYW